MHSSYFGKHPTRVDIDFVEFCYSLDLAGLATLSAGQTGGEANVQLDEGAHRYGY